MKRILRFVILLISFLLISSGCSKQENSIRNVDDIKYKKIAVMTGTLGETMAHSRFPEADIKCFDDVMDAVTALQKKQVDAILTMQTTAQQVIKKDRSLIILPEQLQKEEVVVAARPENTELIAQVNEIIGQLKTDGTLAQMQKRWIKEDLSPYEEPDIVLPEKGNALRVAISATREPFSFVNEKGNKTGFDVELARRIGKALQRPVEFSDMKFMALIPSLKSGKADLIISAIHATPERAKQLAFSQAYFENAQVVLVRKTDVDTNATAGKASGESASIDKTMASSSQFEGRTIGVMTGSTSEMVAEKYFQRSNIKRFDDITDVVLATRLEKVDAGLIAESMVSLAVRNTPELHILPDRFLSENIGVAIKKGNSTLLNEVNRAIGEMKADGTLDSIKESWFGKNGFPYKEAGISPSRKGKELRVGLAATMQPLAFVSHGKLIGHDVDFARQLGLRLQRPVRFEDMKFGSLISALQSGKIDMIISNMTITEERKNFVDFSQPYFSDAQVLFVRKDQGASPGSSTSGSDVDKDSSSRKDEKTTNETGQTSVSGGSGTDSVETAVLKQKNTTSEPASSTFLQSVGESFYSNIIAEKRYILILDGLKITFIIAILSTVLGTLLGAVFCFMRMSKNAILNLMAKTYITMLRGTPVLVFLMLVFYVIFASVNINPVLVAVIAFAMNFAAYAAEIFRSGIEGIDKGQTEAGIAMGFTRTGTFLHIVLPQAIRNFLPVYKGEFISLVKMTSIVGYIAVQDLTKAGDIIRSRTFDAFFPLVMVAVLYFLLSSVLVFALEYFERTLDPQKRRPGGKA